MHEHTFNDIDLVTEQVHGLFDGWVQSTPPDDSLKRYGLLVMKIAVHEWIANLVQHAAFKIQPPLIRLVISPRSSGLHCLVEDNSEGFDFETQIAEQSRKLNNPVPSERGRGLLMMLACTEEFVYETNGDGLQHLEFIVRPPVDSANVPSFFPAADQAPDRS